MLRWPGLSCPSSGPLASALFPVLLPASAPRRSPEPRGAFPFPRRSRGKAPEPSVRGAGPRTVPRVLERSVRAAGARRPLPGAASPGLVPRSCSAPESGPRQALRCPALLKCLEIIVFGFEGRCESLTAQELLNPIPAPPRFGLFFVFVWLVFLWINRFFSTWLLSKCVAEKTPGV